MTRFLRSAAFVGSTLISTLMLATPGGANAQNVPPVTQEDAHTIGMEAYLYLYPIISMEVTRRQLTNVEPAEGTIGGPPNTFNHIRAFPTADMKAVVRPNFDTLYSSAWLDVTEEPVVLSTPDTDGRYYLLPMLDMWTDVFASPGTRTTGDHAGTYLIASPGWRPDLREDLSELKLPAGTQRIDAPTPHIWLIGRTKTDGPSDYEAVHAVQDGYKLASLSHWGKDSKPPSVTIDPSIDMKTPPKVQVDTMSAQDYFALGAELMKANPPHMTDQPIVARMKRVGIEVGKPFDLSSAEDSVQKAFANVPRDAQSLMAWKIPTLARVDNGWSMNTDTMGVYGTYYLKRAIVAQLGLGANLPEDAIYPLNLVDADGQPLDGTNDYVIHFEKSDLPPVDAFWSITLYDKDGFQVSNALNRFAVSSWMPFEYSTDGSLDLYFQVDNPGKDKEANWLPAPAEPYNLTLRLYAPKAEALTGKWNPPSIRRVPATPLLGTQ